MAAAASSRTRRSCGPVLPASQSHLHRSISPSARFSSPSFSSSSSQSSALFSRSASPTRVNLHGSSPMVRFSFDSSPSSPGRSIAVDRVIKKSAPPGERRSCMCSPTTHPGSFRCSYHKNLAAASGSRAVSSPSNRLNARRSAMTNSLVRIGTVEGGDWVKRALAALIRPSSHQQRRRAGFCPRPSRLSMMSKADD